MNDNAPKVTLQTIALGAYQVEILIFFCTMLKSKRKLDVMVHRRTPAVSPVHRGRP